MEDVIGFDLTPSTRPWPNFLIFLRCCLNAECPCGICSWMQRWRAYVGWASMGFATSARRLVQLDTNPPGPIANTDVLEVRDKSTTTRYLRAWKLVYYSARYFSFPGISLHYSYAACSNLTLARSVLRLIYSVLQSLLRLVFAWSSIV